MALLALLIQVSLSVCSLCSVLIHFLNFRSVIVVDLDDLWVIVRGRVELVAEVWMASRFSERRSELIFVFDLNLMSNLVRLSFGVLSKLELLITSTNEIY